MRPILLVLIITLSLLSPVRLMAGEDDTEYVEYTVKKGDTLWDITGGKLSDPFLWPNVWKENPGVKNPDLIYPGQKLRLPRYMLQKQIDVAPPVEKAAPREEPRPAAKAVPIPPRKPMVVDAKMLAASGYIDTKVAGIGRITSTPEGRTIIGKDDYAYISLDNREVPERGRKFYTIRSLGEITHPVTGKSLGYLVEVTGVIEVTGREAGHVKVKVLDSFVEIQTGDPIERYYHLDPFPLVKTAAPAVKGTVVASRDLRLINGNYDIVFIDRGSEDGVKPGNVFTILSREEPSRPIGKIQVISTRARSAAALITRSTAAISRGDYF